MDTPICDFVNEYIKSEKIRLHMPGHKGKSFLGFEDADITEINGADVLYHSAGIIRSSEENASALFGTQKTLYSAQGSSLSIRAMLYLVGLYARENKKSMKIAAGRNAHKTFVTAAAILDFEVDWLGGENKTSGIVSCKLTPSYLENYFAQTSELPVAFYVTSPDYLGCIPDIKALANVCKKYGVLMIADNAHGAYLKFLEPSLHPTDLGVDMCCDSAHKTLPVLTGGAYLHISHGAPSFFSNQAENALSLFASTSPSYLILQSLDMANRYMSDGYAKKLSKLCGKISYLKRDLQNAGFCLVGDEPLKLTLMPKSYGYTGHELAEILEQNRIVCEFCDPDYAVMMLTPEIEEVQIDKLRHVLLSIPQKEPILIGPPKPGEPKSAMTLKQALFSVSEEIKTEGSVGRILSVPSVSCPPAVPVVVCGEIIDEAAAKCMKYYGIESCYVVRQKN